MRLYASVIRLLNLHDVTLPRLGGQHAHAAFFHIIAQVDPQLASTLHDMAGKGARKPFTVSPIFGLPRRTPQPTAPEPLDDRSQQPMPDGAIFLRAGWECWLRVTMLDDGLFQSFVEYFAQIPFPATNEARHESKLPTIRLGEARFLVSEILTTPGSHLWAGTTTLESLQCRLDEPPPERIVLEFHSPTSFKLRDEQVELTPLPRLVFGNLASAWRALRGEDNVRAVETFAEQHMRLSPRKLIRRVIMLHNQPQLGVVGSAEYWLDNTEAPLARALNLLADLAFYTGIGRKTTQGMGMARRLVPTQETIHAQEHRP